MVALAFDFRHLFSFNALVFLEKERQGSEVMAGLFAELGEKRCSSCGLFFPETELQKAHSIRLCQDCLQKRGLLGKRLVSQCSSCHNHFFQQSIVKISEKPYCKTCGLNLLLKERREVKP